MQNQILGFGNSVRLKDTKTVYYLLTFLFEFAAGLTFATYVLFLLVLIYLRARKAEDLLE